MRDELRVNSAFCKDSTILTYELIHRIEREKNETIPKIQSRVKLFEKIFKFTDSLIMTNTSIRIYRIPYYALS